MVSVRKEGKKRKTEEAVCLLRELGVKSDCELPLLCDVQQPGNSESLFSDSAGQEFGWNLACS